MLATGVLQLINPLYPIVLTACSQVNGNHQILKKYISYYFFLIFLIILISSVVFLNFGESLIKFWLGHESNATSIFKLLKILLIGSALQAIYYVVSIIWVVSKQNQQFIFVNVTALILSNIYLPYAINQFGLYGASWNWSINATIGILFFVLSNKHAK